MNEEKMTCPDCNNVKSPQAIRCANCWSVKRLAIEHRKSEKSFDWERLRNELKEYSRDNGLGYYG